MRQTLIFLAGILSSAAVMAADPPQAQWQPAQSLDTTPPVSVPGVQATQPPPTAPPAASGLPAPGNAGTGSTPSLPLPVPPDAALKYAENVAVPLSPEAITQLRSGLDSVQRSTGTAPVTAVPRIRSLTVNLEPGSSLPMIQVLPNYPGVVNFTDQTGAPWPIAAPPVNGNPGGFLVNYLPDTPSMSVQARRAYDTGSVTVYLRGLAVPVVISMSSGEPGNPQASQPTDSRLDLRIPQRGPSARPVATPRQKVGLYDNTLQAFLDGVPPKQAQRVKTQGAVPDVRAWQIGDDIYLRSRAELRDAFDSTLSSADGTHVWKMPVTPFVTFSVQGHNIPLTLELQ
ncbi:conjugal transfer protein TraN [Salmonella enterica]|uniref:Conjugal transfer protein TraN n=2 Tax=Salmonella enterica TaxID=28901 RepID=A0A5V3YLS1_SALER|nr:conjugal transfer protein TraN [Salmonella enterica]EBR8572823.1 conjugal transfer protein TraN [Salmonella enterica subsp. enterica serovar Java]EBW7308962.1 conjugal transfer protein TraN [Salmonella enterica subsp. enterica serovar Enteritidis]EBW9699351.1 conjugal transfer protein TraN [Salmonella enterica subsp. enterica serovar Oranienburg]EKN5803883.1 conjugal transfer protein TraN [Salmonella enterica subsp. enterica]